MEDNSYNNPQPVQQTIIVNESRSNGLGVAGFVLSIIAIFLGWVPILGWIIWFLGALFSLLGVFKTPRGLAIAGLVISFIGVIILCLAGIILAAIGFS